MAYYTISHLLQDENNLNDNNILIDENKDNSISLNILSKQLIQFLIILFFIMIIKELENIKIKMK